MLPLIIVPLIMLVALPLLAAMAPTFVNLPGAGDITELLKRMPPALQQSLAGYSAEQRVLVLLVVYLFAPLFLIVPIMVSNVIAADSFGRKGTQDPRSAPLHPHKRSRSGDSQAPWALRP